MSDDIEELVRMVNAHGDYVVVRKLRPVLSYCTSLSRGVKRALLVDVETTGLSHTDDAIIELGVILFTYDETGQVVDVLASESWLHDPGRAIPADIVHLTGITDADVAGQCIDEVRLRELMPDVRMIIAHNAAFDRPFVDRQLPFLADLHWGCSMSDIPWKSMHFGSPKLDYLLYQHTRTFLDTHHRALDDCRATLHLLATPFADLRTPLGLLLTNCREPRVRVSAVQSPYETKDTLKARGYKWSGDNGRPARTWCKEILVQDTDAELQWLGDHVYANRSCAPTIEKVDLKTRYRA
ncbi:MAG: 3'-5' exonuclease [Gemmatimonadota bacterium]|nr:3'-5' exonuclease [Gemmatimonadota bacterium]